MSGFFLAIHFIVCIFMIIVILLQAGKGAEVGAAFGGASQTVFGPRGAATFLSKVTTIAAVIFLMTSIYLANVSKNKGASSVLRGVTLPSQPPPGALSQPAGAETAPAEEQESTIPAPAPQAETKSKK
jgi:preprotein translocase subunit SecG